MKKETFKEFGKGLIAFGNLVGGLSIVNGFFGINHNLPFTQIAIIIFYSVFTLYLSGLIFINKGAD